MTDAPLPADAAPDALRRRLREAILADEAETIAGLVRSAGLTADQRRRIAARAADLVRAVRAHDAPGLMEEFLAEYGLSTKEGVALMCLAEALLRVPDAETIDDLIQDKIAPHDWGAHLGRASSSLVNASTWALMLTGRVMDEVEPGVLGALHGVVRRLGEPVVRMAVGRAMREMGAQFVLGRDIEEAIRRGQPMVDKGYSYSYDMLGEAAKTDRDAQRYHGAYAQAIAALAHRADKGDIRDNPGISVKLSALHPRYEYPQAPRCVPVLADRLGALARAAAAAGMGLNVDAEEADRLDLSLDVIARVLEDPALAGWDGFGVVVQAYGQRAPHVIDWLAALAERLDRRLMVRLVKGAYWDTEIKRAQVLGLDGFPVFTRKVHTDVSYIACAARLLAAPGLYPQFATHNAHTVAAVLEMAGNNRDGFEFQRLHGMGEALHDQVRLREDTRCRIYAPVGAHRDLLAYLVRRLLENGANSSFVHQIVDEDIAPETIAADPFSVDGLGAPAPGIARGPDLYAPARRNSKGLDITDPLAVRAVLDAQTGAGRWAAGDPARPGTAVPNPARTVEAVGTVHWALPEDAASAFDRARAAQPAWQALGAAARADILDRAAQACEDRMPELMALIAAEAGKTWLDQVGEVREAVDFLRYYAAQARRGLPGPANGVMVCISPWNFPMAIFTGQIAAALAAGNAVLAKPAEQTPLIAAQVAAILHGAGVPDDVLQVLPGAGDVGAALTALPGLGGVAFTGSTEVAKIIDRQLALTAPAARLIAETGGLNAMVVDSTALPEQAVQDIVASAFQSAGQRCSALRILYIQRDVEERFLEMLFGAMDALRIGDPRDLVTDIGPLIDAEAHAKIAAYCAKAEGEGRLLHKIDAPDGGFFLGPHVVRVKGIEDMDEEIFGPVLHVARYDAADIDRVLEAVNAKGYGLTFGLHTRVDGRVQHVIDRIAAGNVYVNRNQIGAIVGSQPFGGQGLSGTGPKAGGPHYLKAFCRTEDAAVPLVEAATVSQQAVAEALARLADGEAASAWAARPDRSAALRAVLRGRAAEAMSAAAALDHGPLDLPGPTGESNRYRLVPRGAVLCLGPGEALLDQVVQALAAGNRVVAAAPSASAALQALRDESASALPLTILHGKLAPEALATLDVDAVACAGSDAAALRAALAGREGAIVPLIRARIAPHAYAHERSICIDTTAAGGNTALLAEQA